MRLAFAAGLLGAVAGPLSSQQAPGTDIYVAPLRGSGERLTIGAPKNVTSRAGYDNQPAFSSDGKRLFYTSVRAGGPNGTTQADIFAVELGSGRSSPVIETPESEYSATLIPGGRELAVIRVERDSTQRLWAFPVAGGAPRLLLERIKPVGYQAWIDRGTVGVFVLGNPATLRVADLATGDGRTLLSGIGRGLQPIRSTGHLSVTQQVATNAWWVIDVDPATASVKPLIRLPDGADYFAWLPDGSLLTAAKNVFYQSRPVPDATWRTVATLSGIGTISRLAVAPDGRSIAFVADDPPAGGR